MKVFAHRGESALYPENSRAAIAACDPSKMAGIELDLYQIEQEFVVFHDRWLTRILGIQKRTADLTQDELQRLIGRDDQPLPTLRWVLETHKDNSLELNLELKEISDIPYFSKTLYALCVEIGFDLGRILVSAFNHQYLQIMSQLAPGVRLGMLLASHPIDAKQSLLPFPLYSVHLDMSCISAALIQAYKALGLQVFVFTVDHELEIDWLIDAGADGIFANSPSDAFKIITSKE